MSLLDNHGKAQVELVLSEAAQELRRVLSDVEPIDAITGHVAESVLDQLTRKIHHATIRATVRRNGEWYNFHYGHHLASGARQVAVKTLGPKLQEFGHAAKFMRGSENYAEAHELISQAEQVLNDVYDSILRKAEIIGETFFQDAVKPDPDLWSQSDAQWGNGFTADVTKINRAWFLAADHLEVEANLLASLRSEWRDGLAQVRALLPD